MKMLSVLFSLVFVGTALAQSGTAGNPNFDRANDWRSGKPNVLTIDSRDVSFDGGPVELPFTLNGGPAEVHLAVYSRDANPQYDGAAFGEGGVGNSMLRAAGLDTLISITGGQTFSEGSNSILGTVGTSTATRSGPAPIRTTSSPWTISPIPLGSVRAARIRTG